MNYRETLQALLDGETLVRDNHEYFIEPVTGDLLELSLETNILHQSYNFPYEFRIKEKVVK